MSMRPDEFDWSWRNEDVIVPEQRTIAVYTNPIGQAVIRAERAWDEDDDTFIIVDYSNLPILIERLQAIASAPRLRSTPEDDGQS